MVESLMKGKKITLPGISPIPWEPCTLFSNSKTETSPGKDREETEAITNAKRASNSKYKTQPCKWFHSGLGCERGDNCDYIHDFNFKGVMPPPHTYKHKKSHMMGSRQHLSSNHLGAVTSSQGHSTMAHQTSPHHPQGHQKAPGSSNLKLTVAEGSHMPASSLSPSLRQYGSRSGGEKDYRQAKVDSYRYRGYMTDDYRRQQFNYRGDEDEEGKRRFYEDERRGNKKRGSEEQEEEPQEGEEEQKEPEEKAEEDKEEPMNQEEVPKEGTEEQGSQEEGENKQSAEAEEGQVQVDYQNKYYNNYNQRMRRNFDNREYYNTNYRRDYHHKRGFSDPYYEDYETEGDYGEQGYNNYYNERGYYGNNYYYGRNRNYRQGYYDQGWGRGRGGWRNNGYRYDDYDEDYYDEDNQTAQGQTGHLPGNPYEEEGQEEMDTNSGQDEAGAREEGQAEQQDEQTDGKEYTAPEEERDQGLVEQETPEEGQTSANEISSKADPNSKEKIPEAGSIANEVQEDDKSGKNEGKDDEEEPARKGKGKRDFQKRERGERGEREDFRRGDRGERYNNTGRYGPFGGKGRYNKNFNYNQGMFGAQGENIPMQMMYNMPFMNMMNNSFDLNTMMHFANNFQNYHQNHQNSQEYERGKDRGQDNFNGHHTGRKGQYPNQRTTSQEENKQAGFDSDNQEDAGKESSQGPHHRPAEISHSELRQADKAPNDEPEKGTQQSQVEGQEQEKPSQEAKTQEGQKHQLSSHKKNSERSRQAEERMEDEPEEDEEEGNDYGEEEQKDDDRNENSYQDEQNEEENYDDQGYVQYNDYRYRNNRDYDHRSAHYHQQQRMKFFNQQFIETLKKYPPDVFKCTFPQFFGMSGGNSANQGSQQVPNNFGNMSGLNFMSYMMNQMMSQNMTGGSGSGQPFQHPQNAYYGANSNYPANPNMPNIMPTSSESQGILHPDQRQPTNEDQISQGFSEGAKMSEIHQLNSESQKDASHYASMNLPVYESTSGQQSASEKNMSFPMSQQQNLFADIMSMHQGFQQGGLQHFGQGAGLMQGQGPQRTIEQDFHVKNPASSMAVQSPKMHDDQRIDINAMLHEDNYVRNLPSDPVSNSHQNESLASSLERPIEDQMPRGFTSENYQEQNKLQRMPANSHQQAKKEIKKDTHQQTVIKNELTTISDYQPEPMMREDIPKNIQQTFNENLGSPMGKNQAESMGGNPSEEAKTESDSKPVLRRSSRKRGKK